MEYKNRGELTANELLSPVHDFTAVQENGATKTATERQSARGIRYERLIRLESLLRSAGMNIRITSENSAAVKHNTMELTVKVTERCVDCNLALPLNVKVCPETLSVINELNDWSRTYGHCEFWSLDGRGRVNLSCLIIDDGRLAHMGQVLTYLVNDLFQFAEKGQKRLQSELSEMYCPGPEEESNMYR